MPYVACRMLHITFRMSHVACRMSHVAFACRMSHVTWIHACTSDARIAHVLAWCCIFDAFVSAWISTWLQNLRGWSRHYRRCIELWMMMCVHVMVCHRLLLCLMLLNNVFGWEHMPGCHAQKSKHGACLHVGAMAMHDDQSITGMITCKPNAFSMIQYCTCVCSDCSTYFFYTFWCTIVSNPISEWWWCNLSWVMHMLTSSHIQFQAHETTLIDETTHACLVHRCDSNLIFFAKCMKSCWFDCLW